MGRIKKTYGESAPLNAPGVLGVEFEALGNQILATIAGFRHALLAVFFRIGEDMEKLMRQNATHRAAQ